MQTFTLSVILYSVLALGTTDISVSLPHHQHQPSHPPAENLADCLRDEDYQEMLDIVEKGLPRAEQPKHIAIVGGGISALNAALLLENAGHTVTIVEASDRVGGRIHTYRNEEEGWYVELGAMRIPNFHRILLTYMEKLGVPRNEFIMEDMNTFYLVNNVLHKTYSVQANPDILHYNLTRDEMGKTPSQLLKDAIRKIDHEVQNYGCNAMFKKFDQYSAKEYMVEQGHLSAGAIKMIGDLLDESCIFYQALTETLYIQSDINDFTKYYEVTGGTDLIVKAFLSVLDATILLNSKVKKITQSDEGVIVSYQETGESRLTELKADYVLVTATAKATHLMEFQPPLSLKKSYALRMVHYDSSTKVVLTFSEKFWEKDGIKGGKSITDLPARFIYYPSHNFKNKDIGVLLASYTWSDDATIFQGMSDEDLKEAILADLVKIHGEHIRSLCTGVLVKKWGVDPYSLGAFAFFTPYQHIDYAKELFASEGRVHFAGEHTALPHAWIETSMKSAIRASKNINHQAKEEEKRAQERRRRHRMEEEQLGGEEAHRMV